MASILMLGLLPPIREYNSPCQAKPNTRLNSLLYPQALTNPLNPYNYSAGKGKLYPDLWIPMQK